MDSTLHRFAHGLALVTAVMAVFLFPSVKSEFVKMDNGLQLDVYHMVEEDPEDCPVAMTVDIGRHVYIHFVNKIDESSEKGEPGKIIENTRDEGYPYDYTVGTQWVIDGLDQALMGRCQGDKVRAIIPPSLAYDNEFTETLPPDERVLPFKTTLGFDVEILEVTDHPDNQDYTHFERLDVNADGKLSKEELHRHFRIPHRFATAEFPDYMWDNEDVDKDGFLSQSEFNGDGDEYGRGNIPPEGTGKPCNEQDEL